jgi:RNA polymerase sigma factor (sigma-70 family)
MLEAEGEYMLALRWRERGEESAAHQLLTSHLRLVAKIAMAYRRYGLPTSDLISEGNIGLLQAIGRFHPDNGVRFSTYAIWWIKARSSPESPPRRCFRRRANVERATRSSAQALLGHAVSYVDVGALEIEADRASEARRR